MLQKISLKRRKFKNPIFYFSALVSGNELAGVKNKTEEGGEPSKLEKDNKPEIGTNGSSMTIKEEEDNKFIYKMPPHETLKKVEGKERSLRVPEPVRTSVDLKFFDNNPKVT